MKVIKYWKVQLLQLSQPSSNLSGIINARTLVESLLFEGYSKDKPKINLGSGVNIELFTAPDSLETRIFRDRLVDSVRCFPVCEDDGDKSEGVDITIHLELRFPNAEPSLVARAQQRRQKKSMTMPVLTASLVAVRALVTATLPTLIRLAAPPSKTW
ncbi:hypothetical protein AAW09_21255 [Escherichia coli]|nr:hypothetical protein AAW09_21255 [Escherichia coli]